MKFRRQLMLFAICGCFAASLTACTTQANAETTAVSAVTSASVSTEEKKADMPDRPERKDFLQELVDSGKLSQTSYDNIQKYMEENKPDMKGFDGTNPPSEPSKDGASESRPEKPSRPDNANGEHSERPSMPADFNNGSFQPGNMPGFGGGMGMMLNQETLDKLLSGELITQAEYDAIQDALPQMPEKPSN